MAAEFVQSTWMGANCPDGGVVMAAELLHKACCKDLRRRELQKSTEGRLLTFTEVLEVFLRVFSPAVGQSLGS
jgi:hypothetical protein